jgi:hypothetical protein
MSAASSAFSTTLTAAPLICTGRLLDSMPRTGTPIALAFSTRKVATAYRGACMRVRRTSDNREQDIGFVQTDLDWESLLTFAAGFDCFVSAWYDQSGRQRHATQTDPLLQPQIVRNGKVVMDTTTNQISVRFNGAYLVTAWEPTEAEMQTGAGIMASASIGLDQKSLQSGTAALTSTLPNNIRVTTEYPSPLLPEGHDLYLLEGLQVRPDGQGTEVVFTGTGGVLTHLTVENGTAVTAIATGIPPVTTPSGPAVLTVDTLATGKPATNNQWRRGIKLDGRIFAIPSNSDQILEIKYASGIPAEQRIVRHTLPPEIVTAGPQGLNKFWTGVAVSSTVGYCIPARAQYVLKINTATSPPTFTAIGTGEGNTPLDTPDNKWHEAVFLGGKVWAVPYNAGKMLIINPVGDVVTVTDGPDLGTGNALFSAAVASGDKVVGVPWNAACFLVANTTTSTITLEGTTGLTPLVESTFNKGYGYIEPPILEVAPPAGVGGTTLQLQATVLMTRSVMSVTMTEQGSAYTSSPSVSWSIGSSIRYGALPSSPKPGVATSGGIAATMAPVDPTNLQLGYKITGVRLTSGGFNLPDNTAQNPTIVFSGGKGTPAKAQAVVADGKVILVNVVVPGTGYTVAPTMQLVGGGGFGAVASVVGVTPIVYTTNPTTGEITSTGGGLVSITVTSTGSGYKNAPEVRIGVAPSSTIPGITGKGVNATAAAETLVDGQVTRVTRSSPGTGYAMESPATTTPFILIDPPQRPGGVQARAYISAVDGTGGIAAITVSDPGSGYTTRPGVTVREVPGVSFGASATCTFEPDGWLSDDVTIVTQGTKYLTRPTVTITGGRGPRDGGLAPLARAGTITVRLDGTSGAGSTAKSPYWSGGGMTSGNGKFLATFVPTGTPSPPVYAFPYSTHRIVKFVTAGNAFTCEDLKLNNPTNPDTNARIWFGTASAQHAAGVAVNTAGSEKFYLLPYNGRKQIVRFTENGGADLLTKVYNGNWNQGILSPANQNIYCVPADTNALLVIDTKQDTKSEMVYFSNVRAAKGTTTGGSGNGKWWGAVLAAGDFLGDGLIFGIPSDVDVVLELNPGVPLRRKTLPAPGVVLPDKRHILFAPSLQSDGSRTVLKYDTLTKTPQYIPAPSTANVSYVEGVVIPDGNVIFVPTYNQTDPFAYTGNVGVFNTNAITNPFSYSTRQVPIGNAAPFPSRTAAALGASTLVSWVPREGTAAMVTYDHGSGTLDATRGIRAQSRVDVAAAVLVGDPATSQQVLVAQPSPTQAIITASPYRDYGTVASQFAAAALTRQNVMVLVPGSSSHITLFYPDAPEKELNVLPVVPETAAEAATLIQFPTRMDPPPDVATEFAAVSWNQPKFSGAIYNGIDQKVYCVPRHYWRVLVIDPVNYSISDFGDLSDGSETPWTVQRYWGGCQGADGKLYFTPYDATRILVVDPTVENPASRISYIDLPPGAGAGSAKWRGAALANDGRIFCAPYNSTSVLIIDPAAKTSAAVGGLDWLGTGPGKFCDVVVGADKNLYFMPARSPYIVGIDPAATTTTALSVVPSTPLDTKIGDHASADRWGGACAAPNGRLYTAPYAYSEVLEYDIRTGVLERLGGSRDYFASSTVDSARWQAIIPGRNGNVYAFPSWWNTILLIETEQTRAHLWTRQGDPAWLTTQPMDGPYRLRPFMLSDRKTAVFHTSGRSSLVMYNVADITANTAPIVGPGVQEGIAAHFPDAEDTILVANVGNLITVTPFQGGIAGVKSFSGNADLFVGTSGPDLDIAVGNASVGVRNILNTLLTDGVAGVYGAHATASELSPGDLNLYLRDVPLGGTTYEWTGQVGNTFAVGVVRGTEEPSFNAPSYRRGFNGLLSELVVFQSDQNGQARALGESSAFYYLDSKLPITQ